MEGIIFVATFVIIGCFYYYKKYLEPFKHIPGPSYVPIFGTTHHFIGRSNAENLETLLKFSRKYGPFWKLHFGPFNVNFVLEDPKDVEAILSSQKTITKSDDYHLLKVSFSRIRKKLRRMNFFLKNFRIGCKKDSSLQPAKNGLLVERSSHQHFILKF